MPILKVLLNEKGKVAGTARLDVAPSGPGAPQGAMLVARRGERAVEVEVDDQTVSMHPEELHGVVTRLAKPARARAKPARASAAREAQKSKRRK